MRGFHPLLGSALLGWLLSAAGAGAVEGVVVHGLSGEPLEGVEVAFLVRQSGEWKEIVRKPTGAGGHFSFSGPFVSAGLNFVLVASYRGVSYPSTELQVGAQKGIIVEVYEPTTSDARIRIESQRIFIALDGIRLEVGQMVQVENSGSKTYVGRNQGEERQVTEFVLPEGLFNLQSLSGSFSRSTDTRFYHSLPLPPGSTQIAFSFDLDQRRLDQGYVHHVVYPTGKLEVFVRPAQIQPGAPFEDLGVVEFRKERYRHLRLAELEPGRGVLIRLPLHKARRWLFKWAALGLGLLAALGLGLKSSPHFQPDADQADADPKTLEPRRRELLQRLARLDDEYLGRESDRAYRTEREHLLRQALDLYRVLEERNERR